MVKNFLDCMQIVLLLGLDKDSVLNGNIVKQVLEKMMLQVTNER